ncbi:MAG: cation transporting ATPase C-terminal domain-containing protein, partial [Bacilli bacterium]|nr:cation transporting ATPase C-terminal domain-containing protein [Bacilli bacterium]
ELLYSLSCRNLKKSVLNRNLFDNKRLTIGLCVLTIVQVIVLTTGLSKFFIVDGIKLVSVAVVLSICFITFIVGELIKPLYTKLFKDYTEVKK